MQITINPIELMQFQGRMGDRADRVKSAIDVILHKSILVLEAKGKYYSPVRTGRMRASISEGIAYGDKTASIGPTVEYAKYVHRHIPFMTAAAEESLKDIQEIADKEIKKALQ